SAAPWCCWPTPPIWPPTRPALACRCWPPTWRPGPPPTAAPSATPAPRSWPPPSTPCSCSAWPRSSSSRRSSGSPPPPPPAAPPSVGSGLMIVFGVVALAGNGVSLLLLRRGQAQSLNVRGAFLEVASDTFGALAVIVSGIVIAATGFNLLDPIASLAVALLI